MHRALRGLALAGAGATIILASALAAAPASANNYPVGSIPAEGATVTVQPGLINLALTRAVASRGYFFAPDPSSQMVSSIGGNVATNAGGPHCLKYGITTNHILGIELVTGTGELIRLGGKAADRPGYDLLGAAVGSEGTFGIVTAVTVRLLHAAEAVKTILASFTAIV